MPVDLRTLGRVVTADVNNSNTTTEVLEAPEQQGAVAIGAVETSASASGDNAVAIGNGTEASGFSATALGFEATSPETNSIALGRLATASDFAATALGVFATASGSRATALGREATASDSDATALGNDAEASGSRATALGREAEASNTNATALGVDATASGDSSTALGRLATVSGTSSTALGNNATASESNATGLGRGAEASGESSTALGRDSEASESSAIALGRNAEASESDAVALGFGATASDFSATALGRNAEELSADGGTFGVSTDDFGPSDWTVPGDFTVQGSKDFEIDHPSKPETHDLRHGAYEGPVPGGLIYSETVEVDGSERSLDGILPGYITEDDFGTAWSDHVNEDEGFNTGYIDTDTWTLHVEEPGVYDVTLIGERDDEKALSNGKYRTEKPKGERWNGEPRTYYRDDPRFDASEYDDVLRVRQKFEHTEDCSPEPCEEAFAGWSVSIETDDAQREKMPGVNMGADLDVVIEAARAKIENE